MSRTLRAFTATLTLLLGLTPTHFSAAVSPISAVPDSADVPRSADPPPDSEITTYDLLKQHLFIKSINPGYKIDDVAETGEAIELANDAEVSLPLSGVFLRYYNSSGTAYTLYEFPEKSMAVGKTILLRFYKSPEVQAAETSVFDATYTKTLALTGSLELVYKNPASEEQILDAVCWIGKSGCLAKFNSAKPTTLVRSDEPPGSDSGLVRPAFEHRADYTPTFSGGLYLPPEPEDAGADTEVVKPQCLDLEFSEILSYFDESEKEQFVELYNPTDETIPLGGCQLKYKNKLYDLVASNAASENLANNEVAGNGFYVYRPSGFKFTKNPNTENEVALVDVTSEVVATMKYPHGQKKSTAYALISNAWQTTYYPTPGAPNIAQEFRTCPLGKILNEETGNCIKPTSLSSIKPCPAGKYRSPETGRCRNVGSSGSAKKPCKDGYERNPETGRCRKIKANNGADYALIPATGGSEKSSFIALGALGAIGVLGIGYTLFQFRREIRYKIKKLLIRFKR